MGREARNGRYGGCHRTGAGPDDAEAISPINGYVVGFAVVWAVATVAVRAALEVMLRLVPDPAG